MRYDPMLSQIREEPLDFSDVTDRHEIVAVYPCTKLLLQMSWRCSTLHEPNCSCDLADRRFPIHTSVSATIHAPEQEANFALVHARFHRKVLEHFPPSSTVKMSPAHVYQHQNHRFSPGNWLSHVIGEFVNCRTDQQASQSFKWWSPGDK